MVPDVEDGSDTTSFVLAILLMNSVDGFSARAVGTTFENESSCIPSWDANALVASAPELLRTSSAAAVRRRVYKLRLTS